MKLFQPTLRLKHFTQVTPDLLKKLNIRAVITDLDDTLAARNCFLPDEQVKQWVERLKNAGIAVTVVSNNHEQRVTDFVRPLNIPAHFDAHKPGKKAILNAIRNAGIPKDETILLGDQLFTDVAAARNCGMKILLVDPVGTFGGWFVQFKRKLEIPLRKRLPYDPV